jgi:hypothetical protein
MTGTNPERKFNLLRSVVLLLIAVVPATGLALTRDGDLGKTSDVSASLSLRIIKGPTIDFPGKGKAKGIGKNKGKGEGKVKEFVLGDRIVAKWFADALSNDGKAAFGICIPEGESRNTISMFENNSSSTDILRSDNEDSAAFKVWLTEEESDPSEAQPDDNCERGIRSKVTIAMVNPSRDNRSSKESTRKKNSKVHGKIKMMIIPE